MSKLTPTVVAVLIATMIAANLWNSGGGQNDSPLSTADTAGRDQRPGMLLQRAPAGPALAAGVTAVRPRWPAEPAALAVQAEYMAEHVGKTLSTKLKYRPMGKKGTEWFGCQIKEADWMLEPYARVHYDLQQTVYTNCTLSSARNTFAKAHSRADEPTWLCPPGSLPCPYCRTASQAPAFAHVSMPLTASTSDAVRWFGMDGLDLFIYLSFFAASDRPAGGRFLEVGNYDGLDNSNTVFFGSTLGWSGVLFEPTTCADKYASNRKARTVKGALCESETTIQSRKYADCGAINVTCQPLLSWTPETEYDFMSIDVEGAEMDVLRSIDFNRIKVKVLLVEWRPRDEFERRAYLRLFGFTCIFINGYKAKATDTQWGGDELCWNTAAGVHPDHTVAQSVISRLSAP